MRAQNVNNTAALTCSVTLDIDKDMDGPLFLYYQLSGYYQNSRRWVSALCPGNAGPSGRASLELEALLLMHAGERRAFGGGAQSANSHASSPRASNGIWPYVQRLSLAAAPAPALPCRYVRSRSNVQLAQAPGPLDTYLCRCAQFVHDEKGSS